MAKLIVQNGYFRLVRTRPRRRSQQARYLTEFRLSDSLGGARWEVQEGGDGRKLEWGYGAHEHAPTGFRTLMQMVGAIEALERRRAAAQRRAEQWKATAHDAWAAAKAAREEAG
ncbi:MAG: hypothetical protein AAF682_19530 [Planctomycetota bacterium]